MTWQIVFKWARNIFAVLGVLGTVLFAVAVGAAISMESQYERRATEASKATPASLESADGLMRAAGLERHGDEQLLGGVNPPWSDGARAEAYCVQARIDFGDTGWTSAATLDPYLLRSAATVLDFAHDKLACIPDSQALREPGGLQFKLLELQLDASGIAHSRIALRAPAGGRYFLVDAWRPGSTSGLSSTSAPSTE